MAFTPFRYKDIVGLSKDALVTGFTTGNLFIILVGVELLAITWIQNKFMETPWSRAIFQVMLGGILVFAAGMLIGNA